MKESKRVIIFSGVSWNATPQRHHKIAYCLASIGYEVTFYEGIKTAKFTLRKLLKKIIHGYKNKESNKNYRGGVIVKRVLNINPQYGFGWFNKISFKFSDIEAEVNRSDIIIVYTPTEAIKCVVKNNQNKLVYDYVRDFENWNGYSKGLRECFIWFLKNSQIVLCDSFFNYNKSLTIRGSEQTYHILPSVNLKTECLVAEEKSEKNIGRIKKIVYFGTVDDHLDIDAFYFLREKGFLIDVYGIVEKKEFLNIFDHKGFIQDEAELLDNLKEYDAIIIPYALDKSMDGVMPAKIMQSLATLKPVIVSKFYDSSILGKYIYVYHDHASLLEEIRNAEKFHAKKLSDIKELVSENTDALFSQKIECIMNKVLNK